LFDPYKKKICFHINQQHYLFWYVAFSLFQEGLFCFKRLNSYQNEENNNVLVAKNVTLDIIIVVVVIIIILTINFMQGTYNYIPETNHVSLVYSVAAVCIYNLCYM